MTIPAAGYEYEADALADGVVAYYPMFDKYISSVITDLIAARNMDVINDPDNTTLVRDIIGFARDLTANGNGTAHAMVQRTADASDLIVYDDWTVAIWFNLKSLTTSLLPMLIDTTSDRGFKAAFSFPGSVPTFSVTFSDAASVFSTTSMPALATDHLLIVTHDLATTTVEAYLDNVLLGSDNAATLNQLSPWQGQILIGDSSTLDSSTENIDGLVDEVVFLNRAIDATERGYLWNVGSGMELITYANSDRVVVEDILAFSDSASFAFEVIANDILGLQDSATLSASVIAEALDSLGISTTAVGVITANVNIGDTLGLSDDGIGNLRHAIEAEDTIGFVSGINIDGEAYVGIIMNTETTAVTEYTGFNFNSMARAGTNRYLAANGAGIYELGGDLDDTAEIDAYFTSKLFDFGSDAFKRMDRAYIALRNDGSMILKTITRDSDGTKHENWYEMEQTSDVIRNQRVKIGKGLKAHYWQFKVTNKLGADFELDTIEFKPIILSRRI